MEITLTSGELGGRAVLLAVVQDAGEKRRTEAALRASEERAQAFTHHIGDDQQKAERAGDAANAPSALLILVTRRPLVQKRADAFLEETGARAQDLAAVFHGNGGVEAGRIDRQVQAFLGQAQTER